MTYGSLDRRQWYNRIQKNRGQEHIRKLRNALEPPFTEEQLDNANEQEFMEMQVKLNSYYLENRRLSVLCGDQPKANWLISLEPRYLWELRQHQKKERENCDLSSDDDDGGDVSEEEIIPTLQLDYYVRLREKARNEGSPSDLDVEFKGKPGIIEGSGLLSDLLDVGIGGKPGIECSGPLDVGVEEKPRIIEGLFSDPLDVPAAGHIGNAVVDGSPSNLIDGNASIEKAAMEKAQEKMPLDFASEEMSGLVYVPAAVSENAGHGGNSMAEGSPSNPVDDDMSVEKADMEKAQEKMPMQKKRKSIPLSPGRISMKKKTK